MSFTVDLHSMFHLCRAALPHMIASGGGAIVNTRRNGTSIPRQTT
ncbi:NAD(P)-dependent dehydrogenase (short-subunit alcohol dehydrogenase family) [Mesorhizobium shonense]|uniref:NAD(P)-dependent dehydrogenase (Short-subunit alcohol dehydrogenase family) n=1 Tax=Mesorhizobium shonense TaxID=1209948 RepID=A0ABV2I543_9HYPH